MLNNISDVVRKKTESIAGNITSMMSLGEVDRTGNRSRLLKVILYYERTIV